MCKPLELGSNNQKSSTSLDQFNKHTPRHNLHLILIGASNRQPQTLSAVYKENLSQMNIILQKYEFDEYAIRGLYYSHYIITTCSN